MKPDTPTPVGETRPSNSLMLALVYAAFAGMWILFSDQVLVWLFNDSADYAMASTFKGLFFVVVTSLLLYGLMRRLEGGAAALQVGQGLRLRWPLLLIFVLVIGLTSVIINRSLARGEGLAVAAWVGVAGLLTLVALGAVLLILRQRAQLQLAQATRNSQEERLRALKLLAAITNSSEDAIFALDLEGRFVMANRVVLADTEKSLDELIGKDESSLFPPEVAAAVMADNQWVLTHGVSRTVEEALPLAGGKQTLLTTKSPLRDESGKIIGLLGISRDITARKRAEDALRASELRFHDIVNASADWIWEIDTLARFTYASESVLDMLGYTPAEILGKTPFDLMPPAEAARLRGAFEDIAARQAPFRDLDNINLHKDGSPRHVSTNGTPMFDANGALVGYRGLDRDITEKRLAQLELEATSNRLRTLINTLPDLVWLKDTNGVYQACNPRFEALYGAREADIIGKTDHDFVPAELADSFRAHDHAAIDAGGPSSNEEEVTFASDGHRETLHTIKTPLYDSTGRVIGVLGIARDITALKQAEARLVAEAAALARLNEISSRLWGMTELGTGLEEILAATLEMLGADKGNVQLLDVDQGGLTIAAQKGFDQAFLEFFRVVGLDDDSACGRALRAARQVVVEDVETDPALAPMLEVMRAADVRAVVSTPLCSRSGRLLGMISAHFRQPHRPGEPELARMALYVRQAADFIENHRITEALRARERYIRALFDNFPFMVWLKDRDGRFLAVNKRLAKVAGASSVKEVLGKTDLDFWPAEMAEHFRADDRAVLESGRPKTVEEEISEGDRRFWLETFKSPVELDGEVIGTVGFARDISERKQAEAALQRLTDDLAATLRAIPDLLFEIDETGRYLKVEATANHLLAAPAMQLLGHTVGEMLPPDAAATVMDALANAARNGSDYGRTIALPLEAGLHQFELSVARKSADSSTGQQFIVLSRDITARKAAEDELRRNNEELQRFNRATVGRELDMVEMKKTINALSRELGRQAPYPLAFLKDGEGAPEGQVS